MSLSRLTLENLDSLRPQKLLPKTMCLPKYRYTHFSIACLSKVLHFCSPQEELIENSETHRLQEITYIQYNLYQNSVECLRNDCLSVLFPSHPFLLTELYFLSSLSLSLSSAALSLSLSASHYIYFLKLCFGSMQPAFQRVQDA